MASFRTIPVLACISLLNAAPVTFHRTAHSIEVEVDGKPFTTYYFLPDVAKPYLMPLRTSSGLILSRPFPDAKQVDEAKAKEPSFEPHQRPLYFGHGNINGLDFWSEAAFAKYYEGGHQAFGRAVLESIEEDRGIRARFRLKDPNNRPIGTETQTLQFSAAPHTRIIDCEFSLEATDGPMTIGDTKEGAFAIRFGPEFSAPLVRMSNSNGAQGEAQIWGKPADWVEYSGVISNVPVHVVIFDHPSSFRHPTTWHARAYGLFAANPFGWREFSKDPLKDGSWTIEEGKSLVFRYEVLIREGELTPDEIRLFYAEYSEK